jgi:DNA-binding NarL/FixJ family response regulator
MRVLLVDDHVLFRQGVASLLAAQPELRVVGEAGSVSEAITMTRDLLPDLVLMDFSLPDGNGLDATQAILAERPETNIVFLTVHGDDEVLFAAIRSGAKGYLLKNVPVSKLLSFIQGLERGEAAISRTLTSRLLTEFSRLGSKPEPNSSRLDELTLREAEVLQELASGASNHEIADRLYITENTVKNHVHNILVKLEMKNRREVAHFARQHGLTNNLFPGQPPDE